MRESFKLKHYRRIRVLAVKNAQLPEYRPKNVQRACNGCKALDAKNKPKTSQ